MLRPPSARFAPIPILLTLSFLAASAGGARAQATNAMILTVAGQVEVARMGDSPWSAAQTNQLLRPADRVRTGRSSRATVQLSDASILRVNQLTSLQIQEPDPAHRTSVLDLKQGAAYFFNRDKPLETQFRTPTASGAVRGTEFQVTVDESGKTSVTLIDGSVDLKNEFGSLQLLSGEQAVVDPGQAPRKTAALDALNIIQWTLYYPGILDPSELGQPLDSSLANSLAAYRAGNLLRALAEYPAGRTSPSPSEKIYHAALLLSVGQAEEAESLLHTIDAAAPAPAGRLADALRSVIATVKNRGTAPASAPTLATEWLAASYYFQSRGQLTEARNAAIAAMQKSPDLGFASARAAELEFSFGDRRAAMAAVEKSIRLAPENAQAHALRGFLLAAENHIAEAQASFDRAIALDGALGNAWLGRGLTQLRRGHAAEGRKDLQVAAALEPNRALLRSYLGKAFSNAGDSAHAFKELDLARKIDPNDPTTWLYLALLDQQQNRINEGVRNLEKSQELNDNRRVFRSQLLLDQDRAVRSANLAAIYRDAGMIDWSVNEATRAVNQDYANYSAHLFLAESYDALRDPKQINLRYETPWLSELLVANLLAPVGAGSLSQNISQQEYSKLFESDRLGFSSRTEYSSHGDWYQNASQFGTFGGTSFAIDAEYRSQRGYRPNNDLENLYVAAKAKQQVTPQDTFYLEANYQDFKAGDLLQYYSQSFASATQRLHERQEPNVLAGWHHEWSPSSHTLFLGARLTDRFDLVDPLATIFTINHNGAGAITSFPLRTFSQNYGSDFTAYSAELQQIFQLPRHTLIFGGRYQAGDTSVGSVVFRNPATAFPPVYGAPASAQQLETDVDRISLYAYEYWQILDPLQFTAGISYDRLHFPVNTDLAPVSPNEQTKERFSPKAGLIYTPWKDTTVRGYFTRSLGGLFYDNSVRLEPTQVAGFNQAYRSLAPESVVGSVPGSEFQTWGVAIEQKFKTRTYVTLDADLLESESTRTVGVYDFHAFTPRALPSGTPEDLTYREKSLTLSVNQLLGEEWSLGARYRLTEADLNDRFSDIPATANPAVRRSVEGVLHQADFFAVYSLPCGFFAQAEATWRSQSNRGYTPDEPGDDFWQFNLYAGYRFPKRHAEVRLGVLDLTDRDYKLSPLTYYLELPRERTFVASLKLTF